MDSLCDDRRAAAVFVEVDQANVRVGATQIVKNCILIDAAAVVSYPAPQLNQSCRTSEQTEKTPDFVVHRDSDDRNWLAHVKAFSGRRSG
jgi:hypothetical protein